MKIKQIFDEIAEDIFALAKKHNITLITGGQIDKNLSYQYNGFSVFITDGTPSLQRQIYTTIGKAVQYPSTLTLTLNRYKNNNL
jgi:hypothetical protein